MLDLRGLIDLACRVLDSLAMSPQEQRALVLRIDRKRAKALRLIQDAERALSDAREDVISAGFSPDMKQVFTDAILAASKAAQMAEKA